MPEQPSTAWRKSSYSGNGNACVELRRHGGHVEIRDTKDHGTGPVLSFRCAEFAAFLTSAKTGAFDPT